MARKAKAKTSESRSRSAPSTKQKPTGATRTKVMGMTVPSSWVEAWETLINSQRGREILASALIAGATAAAAALTKGVKHEKAEQVASEASNQLVDDLSGAAAAVIADAITGATHALLPAPLTSNEQKKRG